MKLIILGGFLGAGKTSILMPLAQEIVKSAGGGDKTRLAIVENEIGKVGIDTAFTEKAGLVTRELFNGCVCCTLTSDLMDTLCDLERQVNPEWVILEATGLARPHDIAESVWNFYDSDMNITNCVIVDAKRWDRIKKITGDLIADQVTNANYILLNKIDLVDRSVVESVKAELKGMSDADIFEVSAAADPEGTAKICADMVAEIASWK